MKLMKCFLLSLQNTAARYEVRSIPTFVVFRNREVLHKVKGADIGAVEAVIAQHVTTEESSAEKGGVSVKGTVSVPGQVKGWRGRGRGEGGSARVNYEQVCLGYSYEHTCTHAHTHTHTHTSHVYTLVTCAVSPTIPGKGKQCN